MGFFSSLDRAQTYLRNERKRGRLRFNGSVFLRDWGHPEHVYSRGWPVRSNMLAHEMVVTYVRYAINASFSRRHGLDRELQPDLEIVIRNRTHAGLRCWVEIELGEHGYQALEERFENYADQFAQHPDKRAPVLWIIHRNSVRGAQIRLDGMRERIGPLRDCAFFTTTQQLLTNPAGPVYVDAAGKPWGHGEGGGQPVVPELGNRVGQSVGSPLGLPWR